MDAYCAVAGIGISTRNLPHNFGYQACVTCMKGGVPKLGAAHVTFSITPHTSLPRTPPSHIPQFKDRGRKDYNLIISCSNQELPHAYVGEDDSAQREIKGL